MLRGVLVSALLVSGIGFLCAGCGGVSSSDRAKAKEQKVSNIKVLARVVGDYMSHHQGRLPQNEAEFVAFVRAASAEARQNIDPDALLVSERDGKPYIVVYEGGSGPPGPGGAPVCLYEQQGVGGKRFVASSLGAIEEVDEARLKQLVPDAK